MARVVGVLLCVFLCLQTVFCQFGFLQRQEERFGDGLGQLLSVPRRIASGIGSAFNRPNNQRRPNWGNNRYPDQGNIVRPDNGEFANDVTVRPVSFPANEDANGQGNREPVVEVSTEGVPPAVEYETTRLPPLTPVTAVDSESRSNFNFGSSGIFQETCQTVTGDVGSCISIMACDPYVKILKEVRSNPKVGQLLQRAHCGFEGNVPKVCCPLPGLPTQPVTATPATQAPTAAPTTAPAPSAKTATVEDFVDSFPEPPVCGMSNASFSRVVGGIDAKLGDFPWMALLGYKRSDGRAGASWLCGGSLISAKHVLTAAHCIHKHEDDLFVVRLGELDLSKDDEGANPVDVLVKSQIKHEEYNPKAFTNDIGLLILDRSVAFTDQIKPICIPKTVSLRSMNFENYNPLIAGWGDTEFRGPRANHLQVLQLPVVSNDKCAQAYVQYKAQVIDNRVLCAGYSQGGRDACQGDSGGPLMQPIWNSETYTTFFYQIGVVSFGKKCAEAGFPGVYTRVTEFVPWLESHVLGQ